VTKAILVAQFLRARAWWRLDSAGANAVHVARSVVSLLDAAGYAQGLPDGDSRITALDAAGCFTGGIFDPGPEGCTIVRGWQLADEASAGPEDLLVLLARAAGRDGQAAHPASLAEPVQPAITIPRQAGPAADRVRPSQARAPGPPPRSRPAAAAARSRTRPACPPGPAG
jgi:hypothetical protein